MDDILLEIYKYQLSAKENASHEIMESVIEAINKRDAKIKELEKDLKKHEDYDNLDERFK